MSGNTYNPWKYMVTRSKRGSRPPPIDKQTNISPKQPRLPFHLKSIKSPSKSQKNLEKMTKY